MSPQNSLSPRTQLTELHGRIVLVRSATDGRNPPTAIRGTIEVGEARNGQPEVRVVLDFPQMFTSRASHRSVVLSAEQIDELLESEVNGTYEITLPDRLNPRAPLGNE